MAPTTAASADTVDAVLFDLDGTLVDSTAAVARAWGRWARERGLDPEGPARMTGRPARDIVVALVGEDGADASLARYTEIARDTLDGVAVLPGAEAALAAVGARGAVVTSSARPIALARLEACGLRVDLPMVCAEDVARGKPDPEPFLRGAALLGVDAGRCLAVEDSPAGVASARAAGCRTVALHHGTGAHDPGAADALVHDLAAVRIDDGGGGLRVTLEART